MKHYSKVDAWLAIVIVVVIGISLYSVWIIPSNEQWIGFLVFIPTVVFMLSFLLNTYYVLEEEYLLCMVGFFPQKIRYENIKSIKKVRNLLSSAALSSDRIEIKEKNKNFFAGTTYISPKDKDEFFEELRTRCPKTIEVL
jgi:uncharacterized membrane protein YciS (DUF1049 family)